MRLDLTKRRLGLMMHARDLLANHREIHVDANAECKLFIMNRVTKKKFFFNSKEEFQSAIYALA